jgi:hypothetical protein
VNYIVIAFDKTQATVNLVNEGEVVPITPAETFSQGSSLGDVIKSVELCIKIRNGGLTPEQQQIADSIKDYRSTKAD